MTPPTAEPRVLEAPESEHSVLGPSSSERWIECPASVRATAGIVDRGSSFAIEGTAAHAVAEACDHEGVRAEHYLGWTVRVRRGSEHTDVECDQEMVDGVQTFLDYVDEFPGESLNESRVDYSAIVRGGFGTMDRAKIEPDGKRVHVFDLKYGKGVPVDATDNPQLKLYALGMDETFSWMAPDVEQYVAHVVQPRLDSISSWAVSRDELIWWGAEVAAPQARKALDGSAEFKAGSWCTFCKIRATCMVKASYVIEAVTGEFDNLDAAIDREPVLTAVLSNDQVARILPKLSGIESWCKALKAHAMGEIAAGRAVGDWKVVEGRSNRAWGADPATVRAAVVAAGVDPEVLYAPAEMLSPAQAEAKLGKKKVILKPLISKPKGKATLAPGSDPRSSMTIDPNEEFDNLEGE